MRKTQGVASSAFGKNRTLCLSREMAAAVAVVTGTPNSRLLLAKSSARLTSLAPQNPRLVKASPHPPLPSTPSTPSHCVTLSIIIFFFPIGALTSQLFLYRNQSCGEKRTLHFAEIRNKLGASCFCQEERQSDRCH